MFVAIVPGGNIVSIDFICKTFMFLPISHYALPANKGCLEQLAPLPWKYIVELYITWWKIVSFCCDTNNENTVGVYPRRRSPLRNFRKTTNFNLKFAVFTDASAEVNAAF